MAIAFPQPSSDTPVVNVTGGKDALVSMETAGDVTIASDTNWANKLYRVKNLTVEAGATLNTFGAVIVVESTLKVDGTIQGVPVGEWGMLSRSGESLLNVGSGTLGAPSSSTMIL